jgi:hypothetical protein
MCHGKGTGTEVSSAPLASPREEDAQHRIVQPTRFHGTVTLDPTRVGRDASLIAEEVI